MMIWSDQSPLLFRDACRCIVSYLICHARLAGPRSAIVRSVDSCTRLWTYLLWLRLAGFGFISIFAYPAEVALFL